MVQGKYDLKRLLGRGGMGAVFLAQDLTLDREVAIKVLPPDYSQDPQVIKRFQQEAKTAAKLDHTNIIPIFRVESEEGLNFFVMKYISGTSLEDVLEQKQPLSLDYVQRVLWEAACALGHAHSRGVVHRDVKPANIMFDHDGRVMLTDFGISKALQSASGLTGTGMIIGTPHYMAPEQAKGQSVDGRADQYSLGVLGYRMLTGQLPFSGDSVHTILYKHIFEEAPRISGARAAVPSHLSNAISRALSKDPEQRFPTMEEFATALWPEQPVSAGKSTPRPQPTRPAARGPVTADTPTEHVAAAAAAPTTPMPSAGLKPKAMAPAKPAAPQKSSKVGLYVAIGVAVVGIGGFLALRGGGKGPGGDTNQQQQTTTTPPSTGTQTATVESTKTPPPVAQNNPPATQQTTPRNTRPQRQSRQNPPPVVQPPPAATEAQGFFTIDADPAGEVYIDGVDAGPTPVVKYGVKPGTHRIRIESAGYQNKNDQLPVEAGNTVRKKYTLVPS